MYISFLALDNREEKKPLSLQRQKTKQHNNKITKQQKK